MTGGDLETCVIATSYGVVRNERRSCVAGIVGSRGNRSPDDRRPRQTTAIELTCQQEADMTLDNRDRA